MTAADWLERQYWADVIAARSVAASERRIARSAQVRSEAAQHCDLAYGAHERQKLDLFLPSGGGPWPLLVFVHGGYWRRGSKDEWAFLAEEWNDRGVALATVGYRLLPGVRIPDIVDDVRGALRFLAERAAELRVDASRAALSGISAGAHLAAMVASSSSLRPRAAALLSGVYDPRPLRLTSLGDDVGESLSCELASISPLALPPPAGCACIVAWGDRETEVFVNQSRTLAHYWANWGVETPACPIAGETHFTIVDCLLGGAGSPVSSFIARHLLGE